MPRLAAWRVLRSGSTTPLRAVEPEVRALDPRDAALVRRLVGTEVRRRGTLRAVLRELLDRPAKADLSAHLHVGLVQLLFLDRIPEHAAVSETLGAVERTLGQSKVPLVNAVLREALRRLERAPSGDPRRDVVGRPLAFHTPMFRDPSEHPLLWAEDALSLPANLLKRWVKRHGEGRAHALARAALDEPDLCVRGVRTTRDELRAVLAAEGVETRPGQGDSHLRVASADAGPLLHGEAFRAGRCVVQGEAAYRAASLVDAQPDERVLDVCAAPGGKSLALLETGAAVTALDTKPEGIAKLEENARRTDLAAKLSALVVDGVAWCRAAHAQAPFDAALVDAPCSNTGVLAARPGARWRFGPATLRELGERQAALLAAAAERVRPGGRLVWSTCSLEPEEGEQRVRHFLESAPDWSLEEEHWSLPLGAVEGGAPGGDPAETLDGGYAARLRKRTDR